MSKDYPSIEPQCPTMSGTSTPTMAGRPPFPPPGKRQYRFPSRTLKKKTLGARAFANLPLFNLPDRPGDLKPIRRPLPSHAPLLSDSEVRPFPKHPRMSHTIPDIHNTSIDTSTRRDVSRIVFRSSFYLFLFYLLFKDPGNYRHSQG